MIARLSVTLAATLCLLGCNQATEPAVDKPADKATPGGQADSSQKKEMQTTPSGLKYLVLKHGTGTVSPKATDTVKVHYTGWTTDGKRFDSSVVRGQPAEFPLGGVIKGWTEGVQLMVEGEKTRFWIPGKMAYGDEPGPSGRPFGMLVFDIELIEIKK